MGEVASAIHQPVLLCTGISGPEKFYPEEASSGGNIQFMNACYSARQVAIPHCSLDLAFLQVMIGCGLPGFDAFDPGAFVERGR